MIICCQYCKVLCQAFGVPDVVYKSNVVIKLFLEKQKLLNWYVKQGRYDYFWQHFVLVQAKVHLSSFIIPFMLC